MDLQEALKLVGEPSTDAQTLYTIATQFPQTHALIALHPNAYDGLLQWLATSGDPAVAEALARRAEIVASVQAAPLPEATAEASEAPTTDVDAPEEPAPVDTSAAEAPLVAEDVTSEPAAESGAPVPAVEPEPAPAAEPDVPVTTPVVEPDVSVTAPEVDETAIASEPSGISTFVAEAATTQLQEQVADTHTVDAQAPYDPPTQYMQPEQVVAPGVTPDTQPTQFAQVPPVAVQGAQVTAQEVYAQPQYDQAQFQQAQYQQPAFQQTPAAQVPVKEKSTTGLKIVAGILGVIVVALLAFVIHLFAFAKDDTPAAQPAETSTTQTSEKASSEEETSKDSKSEKSESSSNGSESPSASASPSTKSDAIQYPAPAGAYSLSSDIYNFFGTQSGNMNCLVGDGFVGCTMLDHEAMIGQCHPGTIVNVKFTSDGEVTVNCSGTMEYGFAGGPPVPDYGQSVDMDDTFACTSEEYGTVCWNKKTGDGFRLSRSTGLKTFSGGPANS